MHWWKGSHSIVLDCWHLSNCQYQQQWIQLHEATRAKSPNATRPWKQFQYGIAFFEVPGSKVDELYYNQHGRLKKETRSSQPSNF
mmetsp:Transcript_31192/g.78933  ORF Transcript_31192/g.78933 Transcript_31192/m.78933 type:complete len:85 (-) Transcript_31192:193-447(-)